MMASGVEWPKVADEALVERLIPAIQRAIVDVTLDGQPAEIQFVQLNAPEVSNALLVILASLLEQAPSCGTPAGVRQTAEAAGKELAQLIRETRQLVRQQQQ